MNELDVLELLESTNSSNTKIDILKKYKSDYLHDLLCAALDFSRKFNIKKFNSIVSNNICAKDMHNNFMHILNLLESRQKTGNDAIALVEEFLSQLTILQQKWYTRILKKNLQIGISSSSANKAGYKIPEFEVMLAKDGKKNTKLSALVKAGGFLSPKFDGYRCLAIKDGDTVTLHSRNGVVYENFPAIEESISKMPQECLILDGEIMSNDFNAMQRSAFASKRGTVVGDVVYNIFDCIPFDEWNTKVFKTNTKDRFVIKASLQNTFNELNISNLNIVTHIYTDDISTCYAMEQQFLSEGYEGAMFLPANIPYYLGKKSNKLIKFKTFKSMDCTVLGIYGGESSKKYENTLGGITVSQENGIQCDCGSGFSDEERATIWSQPDLIIGRIVEIKYQEMTSDNKMRFPIFVRYRDDKE